MRARGTSHDKFQKHSKAVNRFYLLGVRVFSVRARRRNVFAVVSRAAVAMIREEETGIMSAGAEGAGSSLCIQPTLATPNPGYPIFKTAMISVS